MNGNEGNVSDINKTFDPVVFATVLSSAGNGAHPLASNETSIENCLTSNSTQLQKTTVFFRFDASGET